MIIGKSFSTMVSLVDSLQLVAHLPIITVNIPANGMEMFSMAVPVVTYDFLENVDFYNDAILSLTRLEEEEPSQERRMLQVVDDRNVNL